LPSIPVFPSRKQSGVDVKCLQRLTRTGGICTIQVLLGSQGAIDTAKLVMKVHFETLQHRQSTIDRKKQMDVQLQRREAGVIGEIDVPLDYMGMAIGRQGANIKAAQQIPGALCCVASCGTLVSHVSADAELVCTATNQARSLLSGIMSIEVLQGTKTVFRIIGEDEDCVAKAKGFMDYCQLSFKVPGNIVG
jgi:predicted RNA-binding protein YlqC (UPF0109 family)